MRYLRSPLFVISLFNFKSITIMDLAYLVYMIKKFVTINISIWEFYNCLTKIVYLMHDCFYPVFCFEPVDWYCPA